MTRARWVPGWLTVAVLLGGCLGDAAAPPDEISESVLPPLAEASEDAGQQDGPDAMIPDPARAEAGPEDAQRNADTAAARPDEAAATASEPGADDADPADPDRPASDPPDPGRPDPAAPDAEPPPNPALAAARRACADQGGALSPMGAGGTGGMVCLFQTRDAGQRCTARGDCEGECLARSNTCAPVRPLFGCHEVLTSRGARVTECLE